MPNGQKRDLVAVDAIQGEIGAAPEIDISFSRYSGSISPMGRPMRGRLPERAKSCAKRVLASSADCRHHRVLSRIAFGSPEEDFRMERLARKAGYGEQLLGAEIHLGG